MDPDLWGQLSGGQSLAFRDIDVPIERDQHVLPHKGPKIFNRTGNLGYLSLHPSKLDRYLGLTSDLHAHFGVSVSKGRYHHVDHALVGDVCLQLSGPNDELGDNPSLLNDGPRGIGLEDQIELISIVQGGLRIFNPKGHGDQLTVLVSVVEGTEDGERMSARVIRSLPRLQRIDESCSIRIHAEHGTREVVSEYRSPLGSVEVLPRLWVGGEDVRVDDGKLALPTAIEGYQLGNDIVEGRSQVMYDISHHERDVWAWLLRQMRPVGPNPGIGIGIAISDSDVWMTALVSSQFSLDFVQVLFCPKNLASIRPRLVNHDLTLGRDAEQQRRPAETEDATEEGTSGGDPDPQARGCLP